MKLEPQPLRRFLLRLIHLHNLEHMKRFFFLSMQAQGTVEVNGNKGHQVQQVPQQPFRQPALIPNL